MEAMIRCELLQEVDALARLPATLAAAVVHNVETWCRRRFLLTGARRHCVVGKGPQKLPREEGWIVNDSSTAFPTELTLAVVPPNHELLFVAMKLIGYFEEGFRPGFYCVMSADARKMRTRKLICLSPRVYLCAQTFFCPRSISIYTLGS